MSCLIHACFKQRLAQVGTCLAIGRSYHRTAGAVLSVSSMNHRRQFCTPCLIKQFSTSAGPLMTTALARRGRVVNLVKNPEGELRELVEETSGINETLEDLKQSKSRPVITVPVHLEKRLEKLMIRESTKRAIRQKIVDDSRKGVKSRIIIHCKRREFNHYHGQSYAKNADVPLASGKWLHRKSSGDFFTLFPSLKRESQFFMEGTESMSFNDLGISQSLCDSLTHLGINKPTHIQVFAIPLLLKGGYNLVAAETGCGKTLAYLLPIIHQTIEDKRYKVRQIPGHPSTVILAPSRELADQIYLVANQLAYKHGVIVKLLQGGSLASKLNNPPKVSTVDILVATTNAIKVLTSAGTYGTSKLLHVVLDEADTLLDDSFFPELVGPFLNRLDWGNVQHQIQLTLVSATMPKDLKSTLGQVVKVDQFSHCTTPGLHYSMPHVTQQFLRLRKSHKPGKIKELVEQAVENKVPVLIFCNKSKTCDWLSHYLNDEGYDCASVHGRMHLKYRKGRIDMYQRGELDILICTDLASRGIDTVRTQHVINYEFPLHLADYIHRCGRTGRVGSEKGCRVTNFISRPGEVITVQSIERSVRKEQELPDVNANIKRLYEQRYGSFVEIPSIQDDDETANIDGEEEGSDSDSDHEDNSRK